jgi:hypothetical protein
MGGREGRDVISVQRERGTGQEAVRGDSRFGEHIAELWHSFKSKYHFFRPMDYLQKKNLWGVFL